jgi:hypothetical protein
MIRAFPLTPTPTLPRKRGREQTELVARADSIWLNSLWVPCLVIDHRRRAKTRRGFASAIASIPAADNPADRSSASGSMSAGGNE